MMFTSSICQSLLHRHAAEIASLRLSELCHDDDRSIGMVSVCNADDDGDHLLLVDFSRQKMTLDTINHLLRLSASRHLRERIKDLAWGRLAPGTTNHRRRITRQPSDRENQGPIFPAVSFAQELDDRRYTDDDTEMGGSMHLSLRMPANRGMYVTNPYSPRKNALDEIHNQWKQINALSGQIREGKIKGGAGLPLKNVLVVSGGSTVVPSALEFVCRALMQDETASRATWVNQSSVSADPFSSNVSTKNNVEALLQNIVKTPFKSGSGRPFHISGQSLRKRKLKLLTSLDPTAFAEATCDLNPATTCVITLSIDESVEEECKQVTTLARNWLISGESGAEIQNEIVKKQMYLVANNDGIKRANPNNTFLIPKHSRCEAFSSFSAAGLLPLSIVFGWDIVSSFLAGGHSMDQHFVETNPRHNLAVLCALVDLWNDAFLKMHGRVVKPYNVAFGSYPTFVSMLENKVMSGKLGGNGDWSLGRRGKDKKCRPSSVIDGGSHSTSKYSGGQTLCTEFVTALDPGSNTIDTVIIRNNDERICSMFNHADTLAFGSSDFNTRSASNGGLTSPGSPPAIQSCDSVLSVSSGVNGPGSITDSVGNHPSMLIICGRCDAFSCGQLIALAEHRVLVKAWLWGIDPFEFSKPIPKENFVKEGLNQMYQELSIRGTLSEYEDDQKTDSGDAAINVSTRTILKHYATRMQKYRNPTRMNFE